MTSTTVEETEARSWEVLSWEVVSVPAAEADSEEEALAAAVSEVEEPAANSDRKSPALFIQ